MFGVSYIKKIFYINRDIIMSLYNIKEETSYDVLLAPYDTGNLRDSLHPFPKFGIADYTQCEYETLDSGMYYQTNSCRYPTIAEYGSQPSDDILIFDNQ